MHKIFGRAKHVHIDRISQQIFMSTKMSSLSEIFKKALVKTLVEEKRVEIKFKYVDVDLGLDRYFTVKRHYTDSIDVIKTRIVGNIEKASFKHRKRLKRKSPSENDDFKVDVQILHNQAALDSSVILEQILELDNVSLLINNQIFPFYRNPPEVKQIKLPNSFLAGFYVFPTKLELENCVVEDCEFYWSKSSEVIDAGSSSWVPIGKDFRYATSNADVGCYLKLECLPKKGENEGLMQSVIATKPVEAGPGPCPFELRHDFTKTFMDHSGFRLLSYNILADIYADSDYTRTVLHPYCPPYALNIDYRIQLILKELDGYRADVLCLQEVDTKIFNGYLEPTFARFGFSSIFAKKAGDVSEGVSCIFNAQKFKLVESFNYVLSEELANNSLLSDVWDAVQKNEQLKERVLSRTTVCQVVVLDVIGKSKRLVVANTHLYYHPDSDHIRLLQITIGSRLAQNVCRNNTNEVKDACLVYCGDFNSCPGSGVYEFMTEQIVEKNSPIWASNPDEAVRELTVHNPCAMGSAYGTPPFTNYTHLFHGCLDYVFYEKSKFTVEKVAPLPELELVSTGLPNIVFPSDHLALIADLKWA